MSSPPMRRTRRIAVVGAGITGLTAAWALERKGAEVVLFEQKGQPGGTIRSVREDGWLVEYGPNTLQLKDSRLLDLLTALGLGEEMVEANPRATNRYIVRNGALQRVPMGLRDLPGNTLLSKKALLRLLGEPFISRGSDPTESIASFVERRLGREILDYAVNPMVAGIYAGDPEQLSIRHSFPKLWSLEQEYGSLMMGALRGRRRRERGGQRFRTRLISFRDGLQTLPRKLAGALSDIRFNCDVSRVQHGPEGWEILAQGVRFAGFDEVLMNIPLYRYNEQLINGGGALLDVFTTAVYPPLSIIVTGYHRDNVMHPLDGFGFLMPENEEGSILGALFSSTLFPGRSPEDHVLITSFVGGARHPELASLDSMELKKRVAGDLARLVGATGEPVWFDHIYWPHSIPQYGVNYDEVLEALERVEEQNPGVRIAGNFREGISVPDCMLNGIRWAERILG